MRHPIIYLVGPLVALLVPPRAALAQSNSCTYEQCALRFQLTFFSDRIVQGTAATPVGRLGLFAPHIAPLAAAADSARAHYEAFRRNQNRGGTFSLIGGLAAVASVFTLASHASPWSDPPPPAVWVLWGVGISFGIAGGISIRKGRDHLHQAIWFYNGSLVP